jgi:hypothetical protein
MPKFISDAEMKQLEIPSKAQSDRKKRFISDAEMMNYEKASPEKPAPVDASTKAQAALEGFGQGVGMGYLPNLQAGAEQLRQAIDRGAAKLGVGPETPEMVNEKLRAQGFGVIDPAESYVKDRDQNIKRQASLSEQAPGHYLAGQVGGVVASAPLAAKAIAKVPMMSTPAKGFFGKAAQAAGAGAVQGFAQNPGDVEGKITINPDGHLEGAKTGAMLGAGTQVAGALLSKTGKMLQDIPEKMTRLSQTKAFKSAGPMLKDFNRAYGKGRIGELGQEMIDSGLSKPGMTFDDIAEKSSALKEKAGERIGAIYNQIADTAKIKVDPNTLAAELRAVASDPKVRPTIGRKAYDAKMEEVIGDILADPEKLSDIRHLNDLVGQIDNLIDHGKAVKDMKANEEGLLKMRQHLRGSINKMAEETGKMTGDPNLGKELVALNKKYQNMSEISGIAHRKVARENANRLFSPTDYLSGAGGFMYGASQGNGDPIESGIKGALYGAAAGLANKGMRRYGNPALATATNKIAGAVQALPSPVSGTIKQIGNALQGSPAASGAGASNLLNPPDNVQLPAARVAQSEQEKPRREGSLVGYPAPRGADLWAKKGLEKLGISDPLQAELLMGNKQNKQLLIEASDLPAGSKRLEKIKEQLSKEKGKRK